MATTHRCVHDDTSLTALRNLALQFAHVKMAQMEALWEAAEIQRNQYCNRTPDGPRGGQNLSKGNLYCPVFRNAKFANGSKMFPTLYFMVLDEDVLLQSIPPPPRRGSGEASVVSCVPSGSPGCTPGGVAQGPIVSATCPGTPASRSQTEASSASMQSGTKRARHE